MLNLLNKQQTIQILFLQTNEYSLNVFHDWMTFLLSNMSYSSGKYLNWNSVNRINIFFLHDTIILIEATTHFLERKILKLLYFYSSLSLSLVFLWQNFNQVSSKIFLDANSPSVTFTMIESSSSTIVSRMTMAGFTNLSLVPKTKKIVQGHKVNPPRGSQI